VVAGVGTGADAGTHPVHALSCHHHQLSKGTGNLCGGGTYASLAGSAGRTRRTRRTRRTSTGPVDSHTRVAQHHRNQLDRTVAASKYGWAASKTPNAGHGHKGMFAL
jgi:hypothetical protein